LVNKAIIVLLISVD